MDTRVDRISALDLPRVDYLEPLVEDGDWFNRSCRRAYLKFCADVHEVLVDGKVLP